MTPPRRIHWEQEPDVHGYAAAISGPNPGDDLLAEATVTEREDGSGATYDVLGRDGVTVVETGERETVAAAMKAAERGMMRVVLHAAAPC